MCYGLDIALSTLNSCRCLHEPKTRFPVGRLFPFPGRESHPLKAPGLPWRTEKARDVSVQNVVHLLLQEHVRQRIQRVILAAPRAEALRESQKVFLINLVEDGGHSVLDDFVFQSRNSQWTLPSIFFLYVHSSRWQCSVCSAMNPTVQID